VRSFSARGGHWKDGLRAAVHSSACKPQHLLVNPVQMPPLVGLLPATRIRREELHLLPIVYDELRPAIPRSGYSPPARLRFTGILRNSLLTFRRTNHYHRAAKEPSGGTAIEEACDKHSASSDGRPQPPSLLFQFIQGGIASAAGPAFFNVRGLPW
jgi:hypothetical protein